MDFKQALLDRTTKKPRATPKVTPEVKPDKKVKETAVMTMGRFNPPQVGHQQLIKKTEDVAAEHGGSAHILASHSEGNLRNPIPQKAKLKLLSKMVQPSTELRGTSSQEPTLLHAASKLHGQGVKHLKIVAGSDRVKEYQTLLDKYNDGKKYPHGSYKFKSIEVVSAGQRDPDSEGVKGMSGTKMRELARTGQMDKFKTGLPDQLKDKAEEIAGHIRAIHEDFENPYRFNDATPEGTEYMKKMTPGQKIECVTGVWSEKLGTCVSVREAYIQNEIFKLNDVVEAMNGDKGPIVFRGSSYVTILIKEGKAVKHWLKDIQEANIKKPTVVVKPTRKVIENKTPALFMSVKQLHELNNSKMEIEYNGYNTSHLHMCPGASVQLKELIKRKDLNPTYILQAVQASDQYLGIEEEAKKKGFANAQLIHDFNMKLAIAHDTLNMLGYADSDLKYMSNHIQEMAKLSMHGDGTFANDPEVTVPTFGSGTDESYTPKVKETITMSNLRKRIAEMTNNVSTPQYTNSGSYAADPETAHRDVNLKPDKEVYHGIDKTIDGQGYPGKPPGLVSFKAFASTPETQKIEQDKGEAMQDVHRAKAQLATHSSAYKLMRKFHQTELP
jgi:hypothetical protein